MRQRDAFSLMVCVALFFSAHGVMAFPWSIDMFRGQSVQPLAVPPRNTPSGALPVHGEALMNREQADGILHNPITPTAAHLHNGESLFATHCGVCHGPAGKGNGPAAFQMIIPPPDLTITQPTERTDGYLYATIRNGNIVMPAYGDAMSPAERWEVVLYLRQLQGKVSMR